MTRAIPIFLLGFAIVLAGLAASWAQDVVAPWVNEAEAQMGSRVTLTSDGGKYRVITSGPSRPAIEQTGCTIRTSRGSMLGRYQVVAADGLVSIGVILAFGLGTLLMVIGVLLVVLARRRATRGDRT